MYSSAQEPSTPPPKSKGRDRWRETPVKGLGIDQLVEVGRAYLQCMDGVLGQVAKADSISRGVAVREFSYLVAREAELGTRFSRPVSLRLRRVRSANPFETAWWKAEA